MFQFQFQFMLPSYPNSVLFLYHFYSRSSSSCTVLCPIPLPFPVTLHLLCILFCFKLCINYFLQCTASHLQLSLNWLWLRSEVNPASLWARSALLRSVQLILLIMRCIIDSLLNWFHSIFEFNKHVMAAASSATYSSVQFHHNHRHHHQRS